MAKIFYKPTEHSYIWHTENLGTTVLTGCCIDHNTGLIKPECLTACFLTDIQWQILSSCQDKSLAVAVFSRAGVKQLVIVTAAPCSWQGAAAHWATLKQQWQDLGVMYCQEVGLLWKKTEMARLIPGFSITIKMHKAYVQFKFYCNNTKAHLALLPWSAFLFFLSEELWYWCPLVWLCA